MSHKYKNFVRPLSPTETDYTHHSQTLSGEEARKLYLDEIQKTSIGSPPNKCYHSTKVNKEVKHIPVQVSNNELFSIVQNNDVASLQQVLNSNPNKINILDDYGWSLLMTACQANSVQIVEELLKHGADTTVRDKAGNSAQSLVIKNKNFTLAKLLLHYKTNHNQKVNNTHKTSVEQTTSESSNSECYLCEVCNKTFSNKHTHLSSILHNITMSKGKKIPTNYVIPQTNKGYQIMLKTGWDKDSGLGPEGTGKKYPIKVVQKKNRKGLGLEKIKAVDMAKVKPQKQNKTIERDNQRNKRFEINYRREFY